MQAGSFNLLMMEEGEWYFEDVQASLAVLSKVDDAEDDDAVLDRHLEGCVPQRMQFPHSHARRATEPPCSLRFLQDGAERAPVYLHTVPVL